MTSLPSGNKEEPQTHDGWRVFGLCWGAGLPALPCCPPLPCPTCPACPALACPALPYLPCPALPWAALPCPALPCLPCQSSLTGGVRARLFVGNHCFSSSSRHSRGGPTTRHPSISAVLGCVVVYVSNGERKQRARKPPLRGVRGVNPKP